VALDPETQTRQPRRSAALYEEIVRANAITRGMIETYAPDRQDKILGPMPFKQAPRPVSGRPPGRGLEP
jgi:hypothetical protein